MKGRLRSILQYSPGAERILRHLVRSVRGSRVKFISYFYDLRADGKRLHWNRAPGEYWRLSSELIFQFHKLEKGMCLPPQSRRFFGVDAVRATCRLLEEWGAEGRGRDEKVYRSAIETLRAWREETRRILPADHDAALIARVDALLAATTADPSLATPIAVKPAQPDAFMAISDLMHSRRSTRDFVSEPVDFELVEKAAAIAQLSPSACNRQPWHLHFYEDREAIRAMLALQNGNSGFGETVPLLAVVTADLGSFFDASERLEPVLDGGLFLTPFLLALQAQGVSSCCLNWCVPPDTDRKGHELGHIPRDEKILTFLAIGRAREGAVVPLSPRRPLSDVIRRHDGLSASLL